MSEKTDDQGTPVPRDQDNNHFKLLFSNSPPKFADEFKGAPLDDRTTLEMMRDRDSGENPVGYDAIHSRFMNLRFHSYPSVATRPSRRVLREMARRDIDSILDDQLRQAIEDGPTLPETKLDNL